MANPSSAQQKLIKFLKKKNPTIRDEDVPFVLESFKRFVKVVHKIYTEPQAQFYVVDKYKKFKVKNNEIVAEEAGKTKIATANYDELKKVFDKTKKKQNLIDVLKQFTKEVEKDKYGR